MKKFTYLKILNSPFKPFKLKWYIGKTAIGTPYFFPRKACIKTNTFVPLKVGFSSCSLGWKTKWTDKDIRAEWSPTYSFVFFGYQIALTIAAPDRDCGHSYWEGWIYYELYTDKTKSKKERIEQCKKEFPMSWKGWNKVTGEEYVTNHYDYVLKKKYL